jgi:hypothetical protein
MQLILQALLHEAAAQKLSGADIPGKTADVGSNVCTGNF